MWCKKWINFHVQTQLPPFPSEPRVWENSNTQHTTLQRHDNTETVLISTNTKIIRRTGFTTVHEVGSTMPSPNKTFPQSYSFTWNKNQHLQFFFAISIRSMHWAACVKSKPACYSFMKYRSTLIANYKSKILNMHGSCRPKRSLWNGRGKKHIFKSHWCLKHLDFHFPRYFYRWLLRGNERLNSHKVMMWWKIPESLIAIVVMTLMDESVESIMMRRIKPDSLVGYWLLSQALWSRFNFKIALTVVSNHPGIKRNCVEFGSIQTASKKRACGAFVIENSGVCAEMELVPVTGGRHVCIVSDTQKENTHTFARMPFCASRRGKVANRAWNTGYIHSCRQSALLFIPFRFSHILASLVAHRFRFSFWLLCGLFHLIRTADGPFCTSCLFSNRDARLFLHASGWCTIFGSSTVNSGKNVAPRADLVYVLVEDLGILLAVGWRTWNFTTAGGMLDILDLWKLELKLGFCKLLNPISIHEWAPCHCVQDDVPFMIKGNAYLQAHL